MYVSVASFTSQQFKLLFSTAYHYLGSDDVVDSCFNAAHVYSLLYSYVAQLSPTGSPQELRTIILRYDDYEFIIEIDDTST